MKITPRKKSTDLHFQPLFVNLVTGCHNYRATSKTLEPTDTNQYAYVNSRKKFMGVCPLCECPIYLAPKAIICLLENPEMVTNVNGHWITVRGDLVRSINTYEDFIGKVLLEDKIPFMQPQQSRLMKLINWFK